MTINDLKSKWEEFERKDFPASIRGKTIVGTDLVMLHSDAASAIITTFQTQGQVSTRIRNQLSNSIDRLKLVTRELQEPEKQYFQNLLDLAEGARKSLSN